MEQEEGMRRHGRQHTIIWLKKQPSLPPLLSLLPLPSVQEDHTIVVEADEVVDIQIIFLLH